MVYDIEEWIDVPPSYAFDRDLDVKIVDLLRENLEGQVDPELGVIVAVLEASIIGDGVILPPLGDASIYMPVRYRVLAFEPVLLEVVRGIVREAREHGIFVSLGPIDGFVFKNQIMDEPVEYIPDRRGFRGVETGRMVEVGDKVRARITQISRATRRARILRVGMTMRQPYLGKEEWLEELKVKAYGVEEGS
ncbi:MAG: DNA-directed RNA polymerase [Desulfurococcales archaeon]|nr:DNA-directed RNA polymerase [Desulfurococcales archaeon]MEB3778854.1 DNA-directed RNA polymerase [Desulfurococcales archaeon]